MLEHMKRRHTDQITLKFKGPRGNQQEAVKVLKSLGFDTIINPDVIPWRDAFPEFIENEPGVCLSGARSKNNLTQAALAQLTGISRRHISEMENGKRPIGKLNAKRLAKALNVNYRVFL